MPRRWPCLIVVVCLLQFLSRHSLLSSAEDGLEQASGTKSRFHNCLNQLNTLPFSFFTEQHRCAAVHTLPLRKLFQVPTSSFYPIVFSGSCFFGFTCVISLCPEGSGSAGREKRQDLTDAFEEQSANVFISSVDSDH